MKSKKSYLLVFLELTFIFYAFELFGFNSNPTCTCSSEIKKINTSKIDSNSLWHDAQFDQLKIDKRKLKVKYLKIVDTIPSKYLVFENVEKIFIQNSKLQNLNLLNSFPKLREIVFFTSQINLNVNDHWLNKIEILTAEKTTIKGISDFSVLSNLKVLNLAYASFKEFPKNIERVHCLQSIFIDAYGGEIDLSLIDFSKNLCLKRINIGSFNGGLKGIPSGLSNQSLNYIYIKHPRLTVEELKILKKFEKK